MPAHGVSMTNSTPSPNRNAADARRRAKVSRILVEAARIASGQALAWLLRQASG